MAGVKRFDQDVVLDQAARTFWRQGYDATSIQDLEAATGLGRGSIYNAFGDKQGLFLAVLARYGETFGAPPLRHLDDADVGRGLRLMLEAIAARMDDPEKPRGCLMTNSCLAGGGSSPVDAQVALSVRAIEAALEAAFARARAEGQIPPTAEPRRLARFYCAVMQSLGVMHKALGDRETLNDVIEVAMRVWPRGGADAVAAGL